MNETVVYTRWGGWNFGFEHSLVVGKTSRQPYLERWFVMLFGFTLRLHKFYRGDDDRALHDHPWDFITFPLRGYYERIQADFGRSTTVRYVRPLRFHYRQATFQHMVLGDTQLIQWNVWPSRVVYETSAPFWTIVFTTGKKRTWGFWPKGKFVPWREL